MFYLIVRISDRLSHPQEAPITSSQKQGNGGAGHREDFEAFSNHDHDSDHALAASLAYELSMNWGPQIEVWAKLEKKLGLTTPKSGADLPGTDGEPNSGFSLN
jgi:hypothetical protein